ncbi:MULTISPECIES: peptide ABC transporter substrate-binding protein [Actibacterium]|uniref:Oligopeptide transport system substrate-binding protein n=1 Tax=Actibacterium naphthalenivorans TaxID=1614693 RepID=A0A840C992_9RHOB|nr:MULTISPECIES: peptide ABC transporter substrate-binding protein [Actibacterium]ALG90122.1 peptide ABC transporter substrate-binding protein [Actibacterium sp. EMB200-NS6]MBB4021995.1 oligopeptide transport system substrate-binding protein [Actibacterium naphthalenivorans]
MKRTLLFSFLLGTSLATAALAASHMKDGVALADEQVFTYRVLDDIKSFDPQINTDVDGSGVLRDLFEGLFNDDAIGDQVPGAAKGYTLSEDKKTYTFTLRDAKWSNGTPVKASDFVYAWRRLVDPATASEYAWYMELMGVTNASAVTKGELPPEELGVTALDDKTLQVTIDQPLPYFISMLTHSSTFPVPQAVVEELGDQWTRPGNLVGNGAYVLTEYQPGERVVRERNPEYWNNDETIIDKTVALIINDENQALTRYLADELDKTDVPAGQYPRLKAEYPEEAYSFPRSCSYIYFFNMGENGPEYLKDVRVRKALSYAIDRDIIVERILQGGQYPSYNFTHQATAGFKLPPIEWAEWTQAERNEKAKALLAEAGYGKDNPLKVTINYNTDEGHKKIAIAASQFWKQTLGVETELANYEWKVHTDKMQKGDYEIGRYAWCGDYNEASTYLDLMTSYSGHNNAKYSDPEYDRLMAESKTMADPQPNYTAAEAMLAEAMPFAPIYQYTGVIMLKPEAKGWPVENLMQNWYSRDLYITAE